MLREASPEWGTCIGWNDLSCCEKPPLSGEVAVPLGTDGEVRGEFAIA